jgi:hypothetical protein
MANLTKRSTTANFTRLRWETILSNLTRRLRELKEKKEQEERKERELEAFRQKVREEMQRSEIEKQRRLVNGIYSDYMDDVKNSLQSKTNDVINEHNSKINKEKKEYLQKMNFRAKCDRSAYQSFQKTSRNSDNRSNFYEYRFSGKISRHSKTKKILGRKSEYLHREYVRPTSKINWTLQA